MNCLISNTLALELWLRGDFDLFRIYLRSWIRSHSTLSSHRLSFFLHVASLIIGSYNGVVVPEEEDVALDDVVSSDHGVEAFDNEAWKNKRMEWCEEMSANRGQ